MEVYPPSTDLFVTRVVQLRRLFAAATLLASACAADPSASATDDWATRSGSAEAVVEFAGGDGEAWVVTAAGEIKGWGDRYCDSSGCAAPFETPWVTVGGTAVEVKSNGQYTAVRLDDGTVTAWSGGMGVPTPLAVSLPNGEIAVGLTVGQDVVCLRFASGGARCDPLNSNQSPAALAESALGNSVVDLAAGGRHACAVLTSGQVQCWGDNDNGQLGSNAASGITTIGLAGMAQRVATGADHSCALLQSGSVQCWGNSAQGQLGHNSQGVGTVPLPAAATMLALGAEHSCASTTSGDLYCWGSNEFDQLGEGQDLGAIRHVDLAGQSAKRVFSGPSSWTTYAVLNQGALRGWGLNDVGQMGYGDMLSNTNGASWAVGTLPDIDIYDGPDEDEE